MEEDNEVETQLQELEGYLLAAGMEAQAPRYADEQLVEKLRDMLGGEPAQELVAWFRFSERWRLRMIDPSMSGALDIDSAREDLDNHSTVDVEDSGLIVKAAGRWDLVAIGGEATGALYIVSPATAAGAATEKPRVCGFEFGESFFFHATEPPVRSDRSRLPTLAQWLSELVAAHQDGRIVSVGHGGFGMADEEWSGQLQYFPWPLFGSD